MAMNKGELVAAVSQTTGETQKTTELIITSTLNTIIESLAGGDSVKLVGFGLFEVKHRAARVGRNPRKNEELHIPAGKKPVFEPGKMLRDAVK